MPHQGMRPGGRPGTGPLRWLDRRHGREPLALPELPFVDWPRMHGAAPRGTFWKTQYLLDYARGRPFAWVDDDITPYDHEYVDRNHLAAALLLHVDPRLGLLRPDFDRLADWAAAL